MRYQELEHLANPEFKRLCGVSRATFQMRLPESQDANASTPSLRLLQSLLLSDSTVAVADWTREATPGLVKILQFDVPFSGG